MEVRCQSSLPPNVNIWAPWTMFQKLLGVAVVDSLASCSPGRFRRMWVLSVKSCQSVPENIQPLRQYYHDRPGPNSTKDFRFTFPRIWRRWIPYQNFLINTWLTFGSKEKKYASLTIFLLSLSPFRITNYSLNLAIDEGCFYNAENFSNLEMLSSKWHPFLSKGPHLNIPSHHICDNLNFSHDQFPLKCLPRRFPPKMPQKKFSYHKLHPKWFCSCR